MTIVLPPSYVRARRALAGKELPLDWRKLARRKPAMWPGLISLFSASHVRRENAVPGAPGLFFIGTSNAGVLFALDSRGRVVLVDEVERDFPVAIASSFDVFATSFVEGATERDQLERTGRASASRGFGTRWKRVEALAADRRQADTLLAVLIDLGHAYRHAGRAEEFAARMQAFRKQHATRTGLLAKLREEGLLPSGAHR